MAIMEFPHETKKSEMNGPLMGTLRRFPIGAEVVRGKGVHFRVWAPDCRWVQVVLGNRIEDLDSENNGYFSRLLGNIGAGADYAFRLDGRDLLYPDPASRFQPDGPLGKSRVIDPSQFLWSDSDWPGIGRDGQVIYEMHVGTFTPEGNFAAAAEELQELADLGITVVELMPLPEFPGRFGWGYDGVNFFAPTRLYGEPDDVRRFVDRAHTVGLGVILDAVYNHYGPYERVFFDFSKHYCSNRYKTDWGKSPNFDGPQSGPVREYFLANARYWIDEFHFDGLRIDATQNVDDSSEDHILAALAREVRKAAKNRSTLIVAENEPQHCSLVRDPEQSGFGMDALWNDDFHHIARALLTGHNEGYYSDYRGTPQEFVSAVKYGYLYQGQWYRWQKKPRGTPSTGLPPSAFVHYIQNHDQIANSAAGLRSYAVSSPGQHRAMTALLLLGPATPMLFQGQEFAASTPFQYFADFPLKEAQAVIAGRVKFLSQFPSIASSEATSRLPDPTDPETFRQCKLILTERNDHAEVYSLHRDLLRLRREDIVFSGRKFLKLDGAVLGTESFAIRFFSEGPDDRLLLINFGLDQPLAPVPEPLLAPPGNMLWELLWSSENPRYGGGGTPKMIFDDNWKLPGQSAVVLSPKRIDERVEE